jgi:hypothetical protein
MMSLILALISAWVALIAMKWPLKTALFPMVISFSVFGGSVLGLILEVLGKEEEQGENTIDFQFSEGVEDNIVLHRTVVTFSWIMGFFLMIWFFGFPIAVVLFIFFYLKVQHREKWGITLVVTISAWLCFYGLFIRLLHTPMQEGLIFRGLRAIGIG